MCSLVSVDGSLGGIKMQYTVILNESLVSHSSLLYPAVGFRDCCTLCLSNAIYWSALVSSGDVSVRDL